MKRALITAILSAACLAAPVAGAAEQAKPGGAAYKSVLNSFGQPDLGGFWSNATLTPLTRPRQLGDRAVYTPAEVKTLEGGAQLAEARGSPCTRITVLPGSSQPRL
jgi:hypothetical protein